MIETWTVTVTAPDGQTDTGRLGLSGDVSVPPEQIAGSLADMTWRIAMDFAREEGDASEPSEEMGA